MCFSYSHSNNADLPCTSRAIHIGKSTNVSQHNHQAQRISRAASRRVSLDCCSKPTISWNTAAFDQTVFGSAPKTVRSMPVLHFDLLVIVWYISSISGRSFPNSIRFQVLAKTQMRRRSSDILKQISARFAHL